MGVKGKMWTCGFYWGFGGREGYGEGIPLRGNAKKTLVKWVEFGH